MSLVITSLGMISSVGHDVVTSCASIRAGLTRPRKINYFSVLDDDTQETTPLDGCPIHGYTEGFNIVGLWVRVGIGCLQNLIEYGNLPDKSDKKFWSVTGLIGVTPPINDTRFGSDDSFTPEMLKEAYLERLMEVFDHPIPQENLYVVCIGHTGAIAAIRQAQAIMAEKQLERVIILAVDSYLDPMTLDWLAENRRLKTAENPVGATPGEAGACFMVESADSSQNRHAAIQAVIKEPALAVERNHFFSDETSQGIGLAAVISQALSQASVSVPFNGTVISDLNGEQWRAYELGSARVRILDKLGSDAKFIFPCDSIGEIGASSAAVAICVAARSLQRGYAYEDTVLIVSSSDYGQVGAVCLSKAEHHILSQPSQTTK